MSRPATPPYRHCVLFDLDGTLVDTAPDLVAALNRVLVEQGRPPLPYAIARNEVSNGAIGLLRAGFALADGADVAAPLRQRLLEHYAGNLSTFSRFFISLHDLYEFCSEHSACWGIVTNKPGFLTDPLLAALAIPVGTESGPVCAVAGDTVERRKPHPDPLLHAAKLAGLAPDRCIYIGDSPRDIEAGSAARMPTIAAGYGYIRPGANPGNWGADDLARTPAQLFGILRRLILRTTQA